MKSSNSFGLGVGIVLIIFILGFSVGRHRGEKRARDLHKVYDRLEDRYNSSLDTEPWLQSKPDIEKIILYGNSNYIVNTITGIDGWRTSTIIPGWTWTNRVPWKFKTNLVEQAEEVRGEGE